jgi:hypothetical protein
MLAINLALNATRISMMNGKERAMLRRFQHLSSSATGLSLAARFRVWNVTPQVMTQKLENMQKPV